MPTLGRVGHTVTTGCSSTTRLVDSVGPLVGLVQR